MEYREFLDYLVAEIAKHVKGEVHLHTHHVLKNNKEPMDSISILMKGENAAPAIYTETLYEQYRAGTGLEEIVNHVLSYHYEHRRSGHIDVSDYLDFSKIRSDIVCRIVNYEKNKEMLKVVPYHRFLDLAVVYYQKIEDPVYGKASVMIRSSHLELWGKEQYELDLAALENTRGQGFRLTAIGDMIEEMTGMTVDDDGFKGRSMYVMTNEERCHGAINMIFPEYLEMIAEQTGGDFYLLPSSIHECIIIPDKALCGVSAEDMKLMVCEINKEQVAEEELLSDSVYHYFCDRKILTIAA